MYGNSVVFVNVYWKRVNNSINYLILFFFFVPAETWESFTFVVVKSKKTEKKWNKRNMMENHSSGTDVHLSFIEKRERNSHIFQSTYLHNWHSHSQSCGMCKSVNVCQWYSKNHRMNVYTLNCLQIS